MEGNKHEQEWIDTVNTAERQILDLRTVGMCHALALGRFRYRRATAPLEEQRHDGWMILQFVLSGEQKLIVDDREVMIKGGNMIRLLPGTRYGTDIWPEQRGEMAWLILRAEPQGRALGMSETGIRNIHALLSEPSAPLVATMPPEISGLIDSVFDWWHSREEELGKEIIRNRIGALVLAAAAGFSRNRETDLDCANEQRIAKVLGWMEEHPEEQKSGADLAEMAGLSPARFHVHFKRMTGSSPKDYWQRLRVHLAAELLRSDPKLRVTDVAYQLGFSSSQYFATVFRRYLGSSPENYRNGLSSAV